MKIPKNKQKVEPVKIKSEIVPLLDRFHRALLEELKERGLAVIVQ